MSVIISGVQQSQSLVMVLTKDIPGTWLGTRPCNWLISVPKLIEGSSVTMATESFVVLNNYFASIKHITTCIDNSKYVVAVKLGLNEILISFPLAAILGTILKLE